MPATSPPAARCGSPPPSWPGPAAWRRREVADLAAHGLLRPDPAGLHDDADLQVAHAAAGLAAYGVEPRHLRGFRAAADREVGLVEQVVGPRARAPTRQRHAAEVAHLCLALHAALVRGGLSDRTG